MLMPEDSYPIRRRGNDDKYRYHWIAMPTPAQKHELPPRVFHALKGGGRTLDATFDP